MNITVVCDVSPGIKAIEAFRARMASRPRVPLWKRALRRIAR